MYKCDLIRSAVFSSSAAIAFLASHPLVHTHFFLNEHGLPCLETGQGSSCCREQLLGACRGKVVPEIGARLGEVSQSSGESNIPFKVGVEGVERKSFAQFTP